MDKYEAASPTVSVGNGLSLSNNEVKLGGFLEETTLIRQDIYDFDFFTGPSGRVHDKLHHHQ